MSGGFLRINDMERNCQKAGSQDDDSEKKK